METTESEVDFELVYKKIHSLKYNIVSFLLLVVFLSYIQLFKYIQYDQSSITKLVLIWVFLFTLLAFCIKRDVISPATEALSEIKKPISKEKIEAIEFETTKGFNLSNSFFTYVFGALGIIGLIGLLVYDFLKI